ncbi:MAG TPA: acyltransferase [Flavitalea sp.]|nr:acyltransferase [Flavitalea sp.]
MAAIVIVFFHFGIKAPPFDNSFFRPLIVNAGLSVSYFFILSGFVMVVAYSRKHRFFNTAQYLTNRAARILPLYYIAMILMLVYYFIRVNILHTPSNYNVNSGDTLLNALLIQSWIPEKAFTINPPAWSLSVEAFFYLSFPFILSRLIKKLSVKSFVMMVLAFFIFSQLLFHFLIYEWPQNIYYFYFVPILRLNEFMVGTALGTLFLAQTKPLKYSIYGILLIMIVSIFVLRTDISPVDLHNGLFALFFAPMIYLLALNQGTVNKVFSRKPLVFLGKISYGVYIFQFPVYFFFTSALTFAGYKINPPLFYVYLLILLIVSALSHIYIEVPLRKRIRKLNYSTQTTI